MANPRMTKTQLQAALAEQLSIDKKSAGNFLTALVDIAYRETKKKGEFVIPGIGKLVKQKRKARTGVNPKTGEKIKIAAQKVPKFVPGAAFKAAVDPKAAKRKAEKAAAKPVKKAPAKKGAKK